MLGFGRGQLCQDGRLVRCDRAEAHGQDRPFLRQPHQKVLVRQQVAAPCAKLGRGVADHRVEAALRDPANEGGR